MPSFAANLSVAPLLQSMCEQSGDMTLLKVTPDNLRAGATKIDGARSSVAGLPAPDVTKAQAGLVGFGTYAVLPSVHDVTGAAFKHISERFGHMADICRETANTFEATDIKQPGTRKPEWMSQQVGDGLTAMGDLSVPFAEPK